MRCPRPFARLGGALLPTSLAANLLLVPTDLVWGQGEQVRVTGTVTSAVDSSLLPAVRVSVRGTTITTLTATNGRYTLTVPNANDTLAFTIIGFRASQVPIAGRTIVNVVMEAAAIAMQEVVVTGYGTQQRRDVTGAMASVKAEDLTPIAAPTVDQMLQGRVAGVQVIPSSGKPGDNAVIRIRGIGTLNDASPLYVVDGMLLNDISFVNPSDITSVDVLKDASAEAIYGSRGANGVIIITTKRGSLETGNRFTVRAYAGSQKVLHDVKLVDGHDYAVLANELAANTGLPPYFANPNSVGVGTDWQNAIFESAPTQSYELASSGGTARNAYYVSGNLFRQAGVLPHSDFNRLTLRVNNDYQLTDHILFGHNLAFSYVDRERPPDVLGTLYRADPTLGPRNPDGTFTDLSVRATSGGNPAAAVFYTRNEEHGGRLVGNVFAEANVLGHVTLRSSFGLDYNRPEFKIFTPQYFVSPTQQNPINNVLVQQGTTTSWLWENTLTYNYVASVHRLNMLAGISMQAFYQDSLGCKRTSVVGDDESFWYCNAGDAQGQSNFNGGFEWRMLSYLFRANYTFKDRYLFTASLRADGSSKFGPDNRYGYFPSFAVGWNLKEEGFLRDASAISALKLRASWGKIGNEKIGAYPSVALVRSNLNGVFGPGQDLVFGATPIDLANPQLKWESTTQTNLGVDGVLFNGRLAATVDYYRKVTDGILVQVPIPNYVGAQTNAYVNAAKVRNSGVEGTFTWEGKSGALDYEIGLNGATISNKVLALGQGKNEILDGGLGNEVSSTTRTIVGQPIGCFWGFKVAGVFQADGDTLLFPKQGGERAGDLRFTDVNKDNAITAADRTFIGCSIPDIVYGFNTRVRWHSFDLSFNFSGQAGNKVFNGKKAVRFGVENFETSYLGRWTAAGTSNSEPRVTNAGHNYQASDRFIEDGSFLKLQSLQFGYRLPERLAGHFGVSQARFYFSATNLFMITNYTGYTPELTATSGSVMASGIDLGVFPPARTFTVGMDLTL